MAPSKKAAAAQPEEAPEPKKQTLVGGLGLSASCFSKEARTAPDSKRVVRAGVGGAGGQPSIKAFGICLTTGTGATNDGKPQAKFDVFITHTEGMGGTPQALLSDGTVDYVAETKKIELTPEQIEEAESAAGGRRVAKPRELVVNGEATKLDYCLASIIKNKDEAPAAGSKDAPVDPVAGQLVELRNITTTRAYSSAAGCDKIFLNVSRANAVGNAPEDSAQAIFDFACRPEVLAKSAQALLQSCEAFASISPNDAQAQQLQAAAYIFEQRTSAAMSSLLTASAASETTAGAEFLKDLSNKIPPASDHVRGRGDPFGVSTDRGTFVAIAVNAGPPWAPEPINPPTAEQFAVVWPSSVDVGEKNSFVVTFKAAVCMDKEALDQSLEKGESGILTTGERHFAAMFSLGLAAGQLGCTLRSALAPALREIIPHAKFTFFPELLTNNTFSGELRQKLAGGARLFFKLDETLGRTSVLVDFDKFIFKVLAEGVVKYSDDQVPVDPDPNNPKLHVSAPKNAIAPPKYDTHGIQEISKSAWGRRTLVDSQSVKPEFRVVFPGVTDALAKDKDLATDSVRGEVALRAACCALTGASESDEDALRRFVIEQCVVYAIKPASA